METSTWPLGKQDGPAALAPGRRGRSSEGGREKYPFLRVERTRKNGRRVEEFRLSVTTKCNQHCLFCSGEDLSAHPTQDEIRDCLRWVGRACAAGRIVITGGEPTLRPDFPEIVAAALKPARVGSVQVQTNAVVLGAKPERIGPLRDRRLSFFVSLHGVTPEVYDACTGTRGQLGLAIKGIQALVREGRTVVLNCVISRLNVDHLGAWVRGVREMLEGGQGMVHFSAMMCPEHREGAGAILVPYSVVVPRVEAARRLAVHAGLRVKSLLDSTHASIPACLLPMRSQKRSSFPDIACHETGYEDFGKVWVKAQTCKGCRETPHCLGVPRSYALSLGLDELRPLT